jgi:hypothetical protein
VAANQDDEDTGEGEGKEAWSHADIIGSWCEGTDENVLRGWWYLVVL